MVKHSVEHSERAGQQRLDEYLDELATALGHADREDPFRSYCLGLLLDGERKSVEPMAAILNLHERIENKLFLDRTRKDSNFKRPHICATLFQIEKCWPAGLAIRRFVSGQALFRAFPGPGALIAEQHEGFAALPFGSSASTMPVRIGLAAGAVRKRWRQRKAVLTPCGGSASLACARTGHATPLGRGDHRLALAQRPAEVEPALLLPQPGQRRAGQRVEAPAASPAPEPPQSVGLAAADRRPVAAVRAAPFVTRARLDHRRYRRPRRPSGQHLFKLPALVVGQVVHLSKPRPKDAMFHHKLHQYGTNSTIGSRADLTRIEPN